MDTVNKPCRDCGGSRHLRRKDGKGWYRCHCAAEITNILYIKSNLRCGEREYPPRFKSFRPWTLKDLSVTGDYHDFRHMVWHSVSQYEQSGMRYDYMDAYRLVEIYLSRDSEYESVRDLAQFDLLIIALGVADAPNRMLPHLMCQVLTLRKMEGKPTWIYTPKVGTALHSAYTSEMVELLGEIKPPVYHYLDGRAAASNSHYIES